MTTDPEVQYFHPVYIRVSMKAIPRVTSGIHRVPAIHCLLASSQLAMNSTALILVDTHNILQRPQRAGASVLL